MNFTDVTGAITAAHIRNAIKEINRDSCPKNRRSRKWCVMVGKLRYPPKYVLAIAAQISMGRALRPDEHSGGKQTNKVLEKLGFTVAEHPDGSNIPE